MTSKAYAFDIDGVICKTTDSKYDLSIPNQKAIDKINELFDSGNEIIIFTARYMGRTNNDINKAKEIGYNYTLKQLKSWKVKFHKLVFGKPSFDILIDDKAFNYSEKWIKELS